MIVVLESGTGRKQRKLAQEGGGSGIPVQRRLALEARSGVPLDDVRIHYNSERPARLGALAYTQGKHIYLGPGQERHLEHELGHAVQQKQGRVPVTGRVAGLPLNDDPALEREADMASVPRGKAGIRSAEPVQRFRVAVCGPHADIAHLAPDQICDIHDLADPGFQAKVDEFLDEEDESEVDWFYHKDMIYAAVSQKITKPLDQSRAVKLNSAQKQLVWSAVREELNRLLEQEGGILRACELQDHIIGLVEAHQAELIAMFKAHPELLEPAPSPQLLKVPFDLEEDASGNAAKGGNTSAAGGLIYETFKALFRDRLIPDAPATLPVQLFLWHEDGHGDKGFYYSYSGADGAQRRFRFVVAKHVKESELKLYKGKTKQPVVYEITEYCGSFPRTQGNRIRLEGSKMYLGTPTSLGGKNFETLVGAGVTVL